MTKQTEILNDKNYHSIHNEGFIGIINSMGSDEEIVRIARISYQKGTKQVSDDRTLLRYLIRHWHMGPIEMGEITFHIKAPIFVARQWMRHRTANYDELSARYSLIENDFYLPKTVGKQSASNKQGTGEAFDTETQEEIKDFIDSVYVNSYGVYEHLTKQEVSKELARMVLPQGIYTEFFYKTDLRNLLHFLQLRLDKHAQKEIRDYAEAMYQMVKARFPLTIEAFEDYIKDAVQFSRMEIEALQSVLFNHIENEDVNKLRERLEERGCGKREIEEFFVKISAK